ncbi:MAG: bifunctional isocitrate dehydrogenase kinase/phosphatase [Desulfatitalea sp.]|nr:bifunctional isocitrate dehydrogenase kinase/phosphatase [Desulfatitalea sp.]
MPNAQALSDYRKEEAVAESLARLWEGFQAYCDGFTAITRRAQGRFEKRDWQGMRADTLERLDLYGQVVDRTVRRVVDRLGLQAKTPDVWRTLKAGFTDGLKQRTDSELACTFYNSVNRRILQTVGIDPQLEFVAPHPAESAQPPSNGVCFSMTVPAVTPDVIQALLAQYPFKIPFADLHTDARLCAERLRLRLAHAPAPPAPIRIEMLRTPFFREMRAYLIGRICRGDHQVPLVFALENSDQGPGLLVDALLLTTEALRVLFSFSHAYFHVPSETPRELVRFVKQLMPSKRNAELYIGLGYNKHGKTELYRDLLDHQQVCGQDRFDFADGQRGMVMIAFNMPGDDLIYKLIRDRFASPKSATHRQVMEKYDFVFRHDRAGRLVDVQTFENLELDQCCLTSGLLEELSTEARRTVTMTEDRVVLHHVYVERRMIPLDLFLKQADARDAKSAVIDYGRAIKDLARINIFPGDLLIKNFGVTRLGRVVFYDFDELCPLTDCHFRRMPQSRGYEDEMEAEPWFAVGDNDVFPEEFASFLALSSELRQVFFQHHGDLLTPEFWQETQDTIRAGVITPILPYTDAQRLRPAGHAG